ncbi:MAG TPA: pilus assembly protein N-terminal domain-containing protein, partial [Tepidisphaeraceae bacterium]|nr:pilus assembly protein N-terminal domain-containing protein [Tepidisphaeraceae bacterium]
MTRVLVLATVGTISILASVHATGGIAMAAEQPAAQAMPTKSTGDIVADGVGRDGQLHMAVNKTAVITTKVAYKRVSVGQPDIADV